MIKSRKADYWLPTTYKHVIGSRADGEGLTPASCASCHLGTHNIVADLAPILA